MMYACRIYDAQYNVLSPTVTIGPPPSPTFLSGNSNVHQLWEYNGFHIIDTLHSKVFPFFSTYLGRIERDSAPLGSISASSPPQLIATPTPMPKKGWKVRGGATKEVTCWHPTRLVNISIAPLLTQERNIKSCHVPQTGFVPIFSHIDLEDRSFDESWFSNFGRISMIWDGCASELNNRTIPSLHGNIKSTFQAVGSSLSFINSSSSAHSCSK